MYRHFRRIEVASIATLADAITDLGGCAIYTYTDAFRPICVHGLIACTITQTVEQGLRIANIEVTALLNEDLHLTQGVVFRLTALDGTRYIIGSPVSPLPFATISDERPDQPTKLAARRLSIKWRSITSLLEERRAE